MVSPFMYNLHPHKSKQSHLWSPHIFFFSLWCPGQFNNLYLTCKNIGFWCFYLLIAKNSYVKQYLKNYSLLCSELTTTFTQQPVGNNGHPIKWTISIHQIFGPMLLNRWVTGTYFRLPISPCVRQKFPNFSFSKLGNFSEITGIFKLLKILQKSSEKSSEI